MLHKHLSSIESFTQRPLITEQLPLPFPGGHQTLRIPYRFLPDSSASAARVPSSRLRRNILTVALRVSECTPDNPKNLTANAIRCRKILQAASQLFAVEGEVSHG